MCEFARHGRVRSRDNKARKGIKSVHEGANSVQGEAGSEDHQDSPGKGCQRHGIVASKTTIGSACFGYPLQRLEGGAPLRCFASSSVSSLCIIRRSVSSTEVSSKF
jgi:hypothetical protein